MKIKVNRIVIKDLTGRFITHSFSSDSYTVDIKGDVLNLHSTFNGKSTHVVFNTRNHLFYVEDESK
jgi:hypothetical protein